MKKAVTATLVGAGLVFGMSSGVAHSANVVFIKPKTKSSTCLVHPDEDNRSKCFYSIRNYTNKALTVDALSSIGCPYVEHGGEKWILPVRASVRIRLGNKVLAKRDHIPCNAVGNPVKNHPGRGEIYTTSLRVGLPKSNRKTVFHVELFYNNVLASRRPVSAVWDRSKNVWHLSTGKNFTVKTVRLRFDLDQYPGKTYKPVWPR